MITKKLAKSWLFVSNLVSQFSYQDGLNQTH